MGTNAKRSHRKRVDKSDVAESAKLSEAASAAAPEPRHHFLLPRAPAKSKQVGMRVNDEEFGKLLDDAKGVGATSLSQYMRSKCGLELLPE